MTTPETTTARTPWRIVPAALVSLSAVFLYGLGEHAPHWQLVGYGTLAAGLTLALVIDRALLRDLALIALGLVIISTISLEANIEYANIVLFGTVLTLAVLCPYLISRFVYRDHAIRFPIRTGQRWSVPQRWYLVVILALAYLILPYYYISSGVYENWPAVREPDAIARLFVGVNAVGIWDELFFICTCFALFRRHFADWLANILQAVIFVSFLWELGYQAWGPLLTIPFALIQGWTFKITKSLTYVVTVHLLFDLIVFLALVHAHNREWLAIFVY